MTLHAEKRAALRCPDVDFWGMREAVFEHLTSGSHPLIDRVIVVKGGATILRYRGRDGVAYPLVSKHTKRIVTVFSHDQVVAIKNNAKFKKKRKFMQLRKGK